MNKSLITAVIAFFGVTFASCAEPKREPVSPMRIEIVSSQWKALLTATKHLQSRQDYTAEQRKPENYDVWIEASEKEIRVSFLANPRPGDSASKGGNYPYARSTTYVVSAATFEVLNVIASK